MTHRLCLLITELLPAGAERIVYELATRLDPARWEVLVCSLRSPGGDDGAVARQLTAAGVRTAHARMAHKLDPLGALRLLRTLREFRPHVLHAHLFHANLAARLLGRIGGSGTRVVSTVHIVERRDLEARRILERALAFRDHATVCVSEAAARHARDDLGVSSARLRVIHNGVDLRRFQAAPDPAETRAALGLPADGLLIGAVGRLSAQKAPADLVDAFAILAPNHPGAGLVLAGSGEEEQALRSRVRAAGLEDRVWFLGFRDDVPRVLAALDVFCMPSRWEGFGLSLVEALAAGKPTVVSDVDSLPEVLGDAGVLVPAADPRALAAALDRLLTDPEARRDLARRGPERAAAFRVERMVEEYAALYRELLGA